MPDDAITSGTAVIVMGPHGVYSTDANNDKSLGIVAVTAFELLSIVLSPTDSWLF